MFSITHAPYLTILHIHTILHIKYLRLDGALKYIFCPINNIITFGTLHLKKENNNNKIKNITQNAETVPNQ